MFNPVNNQQLLAAMGNNTGASLPSITIASPLQTDHLSGATTTVGTNHDSSEALLQQIQYALMSPNAATPLFEPMPSPAMYNSMGTPLFPDSDDFNVQPDSAGLEADRLQTTVTSGSTPNMLPLQPNFTPTTPVVNGNNTMLFPELSTDTSSENSRGQGDRYLIEESKSVAGTAVRVLQDGTVVVTTKNGTQTLSAAQAAELLNSNKRRRPSATASGLPRPDPPLGAGGVSLIASAAPSPAVSMVDTVNMDPATLKRMKNTDAARRSRLRKVLKMEALERQVQALEAENNSLRTQLAVLTNEKENWNNKEKEMREQIRTLEQRLYDTHRLLSERISRRGDE